MHRSNPRHIRRRTFPHTGTRSTLLSTYAFLLAHLRTDDFRALHASIGQTKQLQNGLDFHQLTRSGTHQNLFTFAKSTDNKSPAHAGDLNFFSSVTR
jgi:hypothetical protein